MLFFFTVLKLPKTESSIRKVFLPKSVAEMLVEWKKGQDKIKETLGEEYMDYNLVMATPFGLPVGTSSIRKALNDLIKEHNLPPVVFHSLRRTSWLPMMIKKSILLASSPSFKKS